MPTPFQGKILPSLVTGAPELTLALANFNFDFTLYKAPAPPEYDGLGDALSKRRRAAAEDGHAHIVARKLGRLFHKFLPSVPGLISAYGQRASEIAKSKFANSRGSRADGVFAEYVGPDGTSIWAAATSSPEAICVHLLACMLARIWPAPHATAIWFEIITERQAELAKLNPDDPLHVSDVAAARLTLTREDLAHWDASARAWLSIADAAMKKEQTQLMLLVDKTKLPVDVTKGVYSSVMKVWVTALNGVDKILGGMSQDVQGGTIVLGLASWHLFPDMHIVTKSVPQHDSTIPNAGILTFGIERSLDETEDGIHWSLPLAHLRYYGEPVRSMGNMGTRSLRLTIPELHLVVLGSTISRLGRHGQDVLGAADLIRSMRQSLLTSAQHVNEGQLAASHHFVAAFPKMNTWFKLLADAADDLLSSTALEWQSKLALVERGSRRYEGFLAPIQSIQTPLFDIWNATTLIPMLTEEGVVRLLRRVIQGATLKPDQLIIRYWHKSASVDSMPESSPEPKLQDVFLPSAFAHSSLPATKSDQSQDKWMKLDPFEDVPYRSVSQNSSVVGSFEDFGGSENHVDLMMKPEDPSSPGAKTSAKSKPRKRARYSSASRGFAKRTKTRASTRLKEKKATSQAALKSAGQASGEATASPFAVGVISRSQLNNNLPEDGYFEYASALSPDDTLDSANKHEIDGNRRGHIRWIKASDADHVRQTQFRKSDETVQLLDITAIEMLEDDGTSFSWRTDAVWKDGVFDEPFDSCYVYVLGHPLFGAIFRRVDAEIDISDDLELQDIMDAMQHQSIRPELFLDHLCDIGRNSDEIDNRVAPTFVRSLQAIAAASTVYKLMPNATVNTSIFSSPIYDARWIPDPTKIDKTAGTIDQRKFEWLSAYTLDRPSTFACIAMFENGSINLDPNGLEQVMALSTVNSIYVAMPLLCDPFDQPQDYEIRHVIGNIGQPGISFLIPPPEPKVKKVDEESWAIVNHSAFDGKYEDFFESTSMHLSFTKLSIPVGLDQYSGQDIEACFRQTLVSLLDSQGKWVADLDILGAFESSLFQRICPSKTCRHDASRRKQPTFQLKSIDNWDEFLDRPRCPAIFRARGNWLARLAASALNVQLGFPTLVLDSEGDAEGDVAVAGPKICWGCTTDQIVKKKRRRQEDMFNNYDANGVPLIIA